MSVRGNKNILCSTTQKYKVLKVIGCGTFGEVAQCRNRRTREKVAVKIFNHPAHLKMARYEVKILKSISLKKHPNLVELIEYFEDRERPCLVFELFHMDLLEFTGTHDTCIANLHAVRPIAQQLLAALDFLSRLGVVHADIKPNNVMLVNDVTMKIKLIDFGLAFRDFQHKQGRLVQNVGYRAPEVELGLPITQAIDVWSLGCVLLFVFIGKHIFHRKCRYRKMKQLVKLLGQPGDHLLKAGPYTHLFFSQLGEVGSQAWRFNTPIEFEKISQAKVGNVSLKRISSLDEITKLFEDESEPAYEDVKVFTHFIKQLLCIDWNKRITCNKALKHPFITMSHLNDCKWGDYLSDSKDWMSLKCTGETQTNKETEKSTKETHTQKVCLLTMENDSHL